MKTNTKEILRWLAIVVFGGFAVWTSITVCYDIVTHAGGDWESSLFSCGMVILFTAPFYVVAYICFRRHYRELFSVLGVVGAIVVFGVLSSLIDRLHISDFFIRHEQDLPSVAVLGVPVSLICFFGPFYAAAWAFRLCRRLAQRPTMRSSELPPADGAGSR